MFNDIFKSIRFALYERTSSPLLVSFFLAWLIWNYKLVLLFFSKETILNKLWIIDEVIYNSFWLGDHLIPSWLIKVTLGIIFPAVSAFVYIYVYPRIALPVFKFHKERQQEIIDAQREAERKALLTVEQSDALYEQMDKLEEEKEKIVNRKDREIERLKKQLEQSPKNIKKTTTSSKLIQSQPTKNDLSEYEVRILKILAEDDVALTEDEIVSRNSEDKVTTKYYLSRLLKNDYIEDRSNSYDYYYELSDKGRELIVTSHIKSTEK